MRPDRAIVQQAIRDSGGVLRKAAAILGVSRQTLYTWIYQLGLEKLAGIRIDTRTGLERRAGIDMSRGEATKTNKTGVYSGASDGRSLRVVPQQAVAEQAIPATVKLPPSLWKKVKTTAIWRGCTVSVIVQEALEREMAAAEKEAKR